MLSLHGLHPVVRREAEIAVQVAQEIGFTPEITSTKRDWAKQLALYENFQQCKARGVFPSAVSLSPGNSCRYPANPPGESAHEYGLAFDSWVPDQWREAWTAIREWRGFRVPANDWIHAEFPRWRELPVELLRDLR